MWLRPRFTWNRVRRRARRVFEKVPGVTWYGPVPRPGTPYAYFHEGSLARRGRWWIQVRAYRLGWGWDEDW